MPIPAKLMSLSLTGKLIVDFCTLAVTAAGGISLRNHLNPETIGAVLSQEGLNLLSDTWDQWDSLVEKHNNSDTKTEKIKDLNTVDKPKLKEKCKALWSMKLTEIKSEEERTRAKENLKNWCVNNPKALAK